MRDRTIYLLEPRETVCVAFNAPGDREARDRTDHSDIVDSPTLKESQQVRKFVMYKVKYF